MSHREKNNHRSRHRTHKRKLANIRKPELFQGVPEASASALPIPGGVTAPHEAVIDTPVVEILP